jgi:hypothetical protein
MRWTGSMSMRQYGIAAGQVIYVTPLNWRLILAIPGGKQRSTDFKEPRSESSP